MIAYFDTSAIIPLLIDEPSSARCRLTWEAADTVVCTRLGYVEAAAALAQATRLDRITESQRRSAGTLLDRVWMAIAVLAVDDALVRAAAGLAHDLALRGYDAVHCAGALRLAGPESVAVSGDVRLLDAWRSRAVDVVDTNA